MENRYECPGIVFKFKNIINKPDSIEYIYEDEKFVIVGKTDKPAINFINPKIIITPDDVIRVEMTLKSRHTNSIYFKQRGPFVKLTIYNNDFEIIFTSDNLGRLIWSDSTNQIVTLTTTKLGIFANTPKIIISTAVRYVGEDKNSKTGPNLSLSEFAMRDQY